jgi:predicted nucleic acid-binding Zn ribbon protein
MERIGGEVQRTLARSGSRDAIPLTALTTAWPSLVGDAIARRAWPLRIARDGTLHVATSSSTWANELTLLGDEILERIRGEL